MTAEVQGTSDVLRHDENIVAQLDEISREVAEKSPLMGQPESVSNLSNEYAQDPKFLAKIEHVTKNYSVLRRVRGDGNCFYRAYAFLLFEMCSKDTSLREKTFSKLETTLKWLVDLGFPSFTTEDFYETFLDTLKTHCEKGSTESLLETFNDDGMSNYLVVFIRLLTSGQLQSDPDNYLPFVEGPYSTMKEFCDKEVMPVDREADHLQIMSLTACIDFPLKIIYVDRTQGEPTELVFPDGQEPLVTLIYRPGHYDILYK